MPDHYCPECGQVEYDCHCRSAKGVAPQTAYPLRWSTPRARAATDSESTLTANQHRRTKYQDQK
jgi:hypothetical protein